MYILGHLHHSKLLSLLEEILIPHGNLFHVVLSPHPRMTAQATAAGKSNSNPTAVNYSPINLWLKFKCLQIRMPLVPEVSKAFADIKAASNAALLDRQRSKEELRNLYQAGKRFSLNKIGLPYLDKICQGQLRPRLQLLGPQARQDERQ